MAKPRSLLVATFAAFFSVVFYAIFPATVKIAPKADRPLRLPELVLRQGVTDHARLCQLMRNDKIGAVSYQSSIARAGANHIAAHKLGVFVAPTKSFTLLPVPYALPKRIYDALLSEINSDTFVGIYQYSKLELVWSTTLAIVEEPIVHFIRQWQANCSPDCTATGFKAYLKNSDDHSAESPMVDVPQMYWFHYLDRVSNFAFIQPSPCFSSSWDDTIKQMQKGLILPLKHKLHGECAEEVVRSGTFDPEQAVEQLLTKIGSKLDPEKVSALICKLRWEDYYCLGLPLPSSCTDEYGNFDDRKVDLVLS